MIINRDVDPTYLFIFYTHHRPILHRFATKHNSADIQTGFGIGRLKSSVFRPIIDPRYIYCSIPDGRFSKTVIAPVNVQRLKCCLAAFRFTSYKLIVRFRALCGKH